MTDGRPPFRSVKESQIHASVRFLGQEQIQMIDEALAEIGEFGEVRLVVEKGRLRFVVTQTSRDALRWQAGPSDKRLR